VIQLRDDVRHEACDTHVACFLSFSSILFEVIKRHEVAQFGTVMNAYSQYAWAILQVALVKLIDLVREDNLAGQC
jgi:hypothetical protein